MQPPHQIEVIEVISDADDGVEVQSLDYSHLSHFMHVECQVVLVDCQRSASVGLIQHFPLQLWPLQL